MHFFFQRTISEWIVSIFFFEDLFRQRKSKMTWIKFDVNFLEPVPSGIGIQIAAGRQREGGFNEMNRRTLARDGMQGRPRRR